jgi:hypothetical protein
MTDHGVIVDSLKQHEVGGFLALLERSAFEHYSSAGKISDISVCIGLNRMLSLSSRRNDSLTKQYHAALNLTTKVQHKEVAFFWDVQWFGQAGEKVEYNTVRHFYKQLKKKDSEKAKAFLDENESATSTSPPYQELREFLRTHAYTKGFVTKYQGRGDPVYFTLVDSDTIDFNCVFSAYARIINKHALPPTVMSTGYEFRSPEPGMKPWIDGSKIDRAIRVATAKHFPEGVYYPEPNLCTLVPPTLDTLPESFIDRKIDGKKCESVALLRHLVKNRAGGVVTFVFSGDAPLITDIPKRAMHYKASQKTIEFSEGYAKGVEEPSDEDISHLAQISQTHLNMMVWANNLHAHRVFEIKGPYSKGKFVKFIVALRNGSYSQDTIDAIEDIVSPKFVVDRLVRAAKEVKKAITTFFGREVRDELEIDFTDFDVLSVVDRAFLDETISGDRNIFVSGLKSGASISQLIKLYKNDQPKFQTLVSSKAVSICSSGGIFEEVTFEMLCELYDKILDVGGSDEDFIELIDDQLGLFDGSYGDLDFDEIINVFLESLGIEDETKTAYEQTCDTFAGRFEEEWGARDEDDEYAQEECDTGASEDASLYPVGSFEEVQSRLLSCRSQILRNKLLNSKFGAEGSQALLIISNTFAGSTKDVSLFQAVRSKVAKTIEEIKKHHTLRDDTIKLISEITSLFPGQAVSQDIQASIREYTFLSQSLSTIEFVSEVLGEVGVCYYGFE